MNNLNSIKLFLAITMIGIPILLFYAFYGDGGFDWDKMVKQLKKRII